MLHITKVSTYGPTAKSLKKEFVLVLHGIMGMGRNGPDLLKGYPQGEYHTSARALTLRYWRTSLHSVIREDRPEHFVLESFAEFKLRCKAQG